MAATFTPGLTLSGAFYPEVVRPLLDEAFPKLGYAAALLGPGSEVLGELSQARARLAWYPRDVWLYVLACQWQRVAQEEAFPGRCAEADDELGSAIVTARLASALMRLCLLMRLRLPPYGKWPGPALPRPPRPAAIAPSLAAA